MLLYSLPTLLTLFVLFPMFTLTSATLSRSRLLLHPLPNLLNVYGPSVETLKTDIEAGKIQNR